MKRASVFLLMTSLVALVTSSPLSLHSESNKGCQLEVVKDKIVSRAISSKVVVKLTEYHHDNVTVHLISYGNKTQMTQQDEYVKEFETMVTAEHLGRNYFNVCVTGCEGCEEVELYAIPAPVTLLPPILTVLLAVITRQVLLSLTCGVFSAAFLAAAYNPLTAFIDTFNTYLVLPFLDPGKAAVILFSCLMSGLIENLEKCGGAEGLANQVFKLASTTYHGAVLTVSISFAFFFDDFASIMISGKSLGPLVSKLGLSVQKFSLIVHMMAVVVASLCPLSSWAGIQIGYIESAFELTGIKVSGFPYLLHSIPYRFFVVTVLLATIIYVLLDKDIAPMIQYEEQSKYDLRTKSVDEESVSSDSSDRKSEGEVIEVDEIPKRWYNAIVPLVVLVVVSLTRMYYDGKEAIEALDDDDTPLTFINCVSKCNSINSLIVGTSTALLLTFVMIPAQRIFGLSKCLEHFVGGVKSMSEPCMILVLAWSLGFAMNDIHTSEYIAQALGNNLPVEYFPALVCVIGYAMSYASGSAMGTQGIIFPLIIPVIVHLTTNEDIYVKTIAAAFSSTVFGNLCSPIADTTIAGVLFTGCPMLDHIKVMSTFCLPVALISVIFGDLLVGLNVYPFYVSYLVTLLVVVVVFVFFGRRPGRRSLVQRIRDQAWGLKKSASSGSSVSMEQGERTLLLGDKV